ncbi:MAG: hypothetical protein E6J69_12700 [Deltaproteobacteria bacterium]|nr:MAG: hypothetical protein E6J69_12700 [Deltaproteobacteria bacterium]
MAGRSINGALRFILGVLGWGALWGAAMGLCLFAPRLLQDHHADPSTALGWLTFAAVLLGVFGAIGALCSLLAALIVVGWQVGRRRLYRDVGWTVGLTMGALLPPVYLAAAAAVESGTFKHVVSAKHYARYAPAAIGAYLVFCVVLRLAYGWVLGRRARPPTTSLAVGLAATALAGAAVLPLRVSIPARPESPSATTLIARPGATGGAPPLLFVGLDGGNWETLEPMLARGALPTFGRFVSEGIRGDMQAAWPPYWSVPAWAAILTAHSPEENGVFGDMMVEVPGLPDLVAPTDVDLLLDPFFLLEFTLSDWGVVHIRHPPRRALHSPPVWEMLSRAGVETGVIRFDFTYPAGDEAEFVVSSWAGRDTWQLGSSRPARGPDIATAAARRAGLLAPFSDDEPPDARLLAELLPRVDRPPPADAVVNPINVLRIAVEIDRRTLESAERLIHVRPELPVLAVYLPGFDKVCHAFWQYRFPEDYGAMRPAAEDSAELGPVVDRYLAFVDRTLGRLIAAYGQVPNVIVLSDHGFEANLTHPMWRGWHSARGILIAAGPSFPHRDAPLAVSYYDVVPTVTDVMGFAAPAGMRGSSLLRR